ncbi:Germination protease precursor [compost metagenome]
MLDDISEPERLGLVREVLQPLGHDLIVTPKEIDEFIEDIANIIATGLNAALHEAVDPGNVAAYTH